MRSMKLSVAKTLKRHGSLGILRAFITGAGSYNPGSGKVESANEPSADSTRAMVLLDQMTKTPSRSYGGAGVTEVANTLVEGVEKWCLMDAIGREPRIQDHVVVGGNEWHILNIQTQSDKTGPVLYVLAMAR